MAKFKTRARTVDMLGRQQIAGIPNAISELFKNAHDAYADKVQVDYFQSDGLFVLKDNGLGMTLEDFQNRWLVLGTESKLGSAGMDLPPVDRNKPRRPIIGEKGIGRLAIAVIGSQVLLLTRAEREGRLHDLVAAFVNWGLFEIPGVNLEDIDIPVRVFPEGALPSPEDIQNMVTSVKKNLNAIKSCMEEGRYSAILKELEMFRGFDLTDPTIGGSSLLNNRGTQFYILPASESLLAEIEIDSGGNEISNLKKLLIGFSNTMLEKDAEPPIKTTFRYWETDDSPREYIGESDFFTPADFEKADHHIVGAFDEFGVFSGTVDVYGKGTQEYILPWNEALGQPTECGPFRISIAYVHGRQNESNLSPQDFVDVDRKLSLLSGLYIYRHGIRVLPYGDSDFDWLGIEKRRTKSASYYFFSYRRLFGAIEISSDNKKLVEKAGREGFQENKAYRQLRDILTNFLLRLAADFFRKGGDYSETFIDQKEFFEALKKAKNLREKKSKEKRKRFQSILESFFEKAQQGLLTKEVNALRNELIRGIESAVARNRYGSGGDVLLKVEMDFSSNFEKLVNDYTLSLPRGVGLTKTLKRDWQAYQLERNRLEEDVFEPFRKKAAQMVTEAAEKHNLALDRKKRARNLLASNIGRYQKELRKEAESLRKTLDTARTSISALTRTVLKRARETIDNAEASFNRADLDTMDQAQLSRFRGGLEKQVEEVAENGRLVLEHIRAQLQNINWEESDRGFFIGDAEIQASLEDEVLALREEAETLLEVTQLGMAIEVINHEFENAIKSVRQNLRRLKSWADLNPEMESLYQSLRTSFDHLDGYLTLFTPIHRRLYRNEIEIKGAEIGTYLSNLFSERLRKNGIELRQSAAFREKTILGFPSTFYPVFINLVDNAIFWLKDRLEPRVIELDADGSGFLVSDNGPGIPARSRTAIFERGYTTKPGGRGLGLFISRENLTKVGYDLLVAEKDSGGTTFKIKKIT